MMIRNGIEKEAAKWRLKTIRAFSMREPQKDLVQLAKYGAVIIIGEMTSEALAEISQQMPILSWWIIIVKPQLRLHPNRFCPKDPPDPHDVKREGP